MNRISIVLSAILLLTASVFADDWSQFRGPNRDGVSKESGLLKKWPKEGPTRVWENNKIGQGVSSVAVVGNNIYTNSQLKKMEYLLCIDAETGKVKWSTPIAPAQNNGGGLGSKSTPTVHRDMVYTMGTSGEIVCCDASSGKILWRKNMVRDMGGVVPANGYGESLMVDGKWLICTPGGETATVCALLRVNGQPVLLSETHPWKCVTGEMASDVSIIKASIGKIQQYIVTTNKSVVGVRVRGGDKLWSYDKLGNDNNCGSMPIWYAQTLFVASGSSAVLIWPKKAQGVSAFTVNEIYNSDEFFTAPMYPPVRVNHTIFGTSGDRFVCFSLKEGKLQWATEKCGKGCVCTYADGSLYVQNAQGELYLVSANSKNFALNGKMKIADGAKMPGVTAPVIANGKMYIRSNSSLACYDISDKSKTEPQSDNSTTDKPKAPLMPTTKPSSKDNSDTSLSEMKAPGTGPKPSAKPVDTQTPTTPKRKLPGMP